jgi:hypothetical protein
MNLNTISLRYKLGMKWESQDENSLQGTTKLVFSPKLVLMGFSTPILDLPYLCALIAGSYSLLNQALSEE